MGLGRLTSSVMLTRSAWASALEAFASHAFFSSAFACGKSLDTHRHRIVSTNQHAEKKDTHRQEQYTLC